MADWRVLLLWGFGGLLATIMLTGITRRRREMLTGSLRENVRRRRARRSAPPARQPDADAESNQQL